VSGRILYDENFAFVWRALRRLGVPDSDLADVLQEVFVVVHRKLGEFEGRSQVTTWLFRIAFRAARDRRNRAHVRREVPSLDAMNGAADTHGDPEDELQKGAPQGRRVLHLGDAAVPVGGLRRDGAALAQHPDGIRAVRTANDRRAGSRASARKVSRCSETTLYKTVSSGWRRA
jgi:RNA polymerase sigma factor (sigma-70 family)